MPWAFSLKHYSFAKNRNVVKLWKTVPSSRRGLVRFNFWERSAVNPVTICMTLDAAKRNGIPLEISLRGGYQRRMVIRSVGSNFFSGQDPGRSRAELLVSMTAVSMITTVLPVLGDLPSNRPRALLGTFLSQLCHQQTKVILVLREFVLKGRVSEVGLDCIRFSQRESSDVIVPLHDFLWLEACGET